MFNELPAPNGTHFPTVLLGFKSAVNNSANYDNTIF